MRKLMIALVLTTVPLTSFADDSELVKKVHTASVHFLEKFSVNDLSYDLADENEELKVLLPIIDEATPGCKERHVPEVCEELRFMQERVLPVIKHIADYAEDKEHEESPEGMIEDACDAARQIKQLQAIINHEKEVGKVSGFVNAMNLHKAGNALVQQKYRLASIVTAYKTKTKKDLKVTACK